MSDQKLENCDRCGRDHNRNPKHDDKPRRDRKRCEKCDTCLFAITLSEINLETATVLANASLDERRRAVLVYLRLRILEIASEAFECIYSYGGCCEKYAKAVQEAALAAAVSGKAIVVEYDAEPARWNFLNPDNSEPPVRVLNDPAWLGVLIELQVFEDLVEDFRDAMRLKKKEKNGEETEESG